MLNYMLDILYIAVLCEFTLLGRREASQHAPREPGSWGLSQYKVRQVQTHVPERKWSILQGGAQNQAEEDTVYMGGAEVEQVPVNQHHWKPDGHHTSTPTQHRNVLVKWRHRILQVNRIRILWWVTGKWGAGDWDRWWDSLRASGGWMEKGGAGEFLRNAWGSGGKWLEVSGDRGTDRVK